jgi:hypothetical protein
MKMRQQREMALKEAQWQGRAGGLDKGAPEDSPIKRRKKKAQRGELLPIGDILNEANAVSDEDSSFKDFPVIHTMYCRC